MSRSLAKDNVGVTALMDYMFMMMITLIIFTIMLLMVQQVLSKSDSIVLKEEFDIISNDVANRLSAFSSEVSLNGQSGDDEKASVGHQAVYFDLPGLVRGKQYNVDVTYDSALKKGTVTVSYVSNSNIMSRATFYSETGISHCNFNSQAGRYRVYYDGANIQIGAGA